MAVARMNAQSRNLWRALHESGDPCATVTALDIMAREEQWRSYDSMRTYASIEVIMNGRNMLGVGVVYRGR